LDRRTNTSDGSGGASPTVVTERDDDDLSAEEDQPTQILGTSSLRAAAKSANGSAADEKDAAVEDVPALPADTIGSPRDSSTFSQSAPAATDAADDRLPADNGTPSPAAETIPAEAEPAPADTGTGWPAPSAPFDSGTTAERSAGDSAPADSPQPSRSPEPGTVSAAAFVWDPPEPAPTSPSSPARNFLRSRAGAKASDPPREPAVSVSPAKEPAAHAAPSAASAPVAGDAAGAGTRSKRSSRRSARQAHLTIARVEPWSVMKLSFVVSLVAFVILFVAVSVIYGTLSAIGVFTSLQHVVQSVTSSQNSNGVNTSKWFTASRVLSYTALLGALNIVLITAMCTIGAVVYNLTSRLIGGVEVTLRETE
jgi:Transmembrane domain of unknown function (DUF3566)